MSSMKFDCLRQSGSIDWPNRICKVCGDFIKNPSEGCDDGDSSGGDGCSGTCA